MAFSEKAAYLKGLIEGLEIDKDTKEGKIFCAISDLLAEMAAEVDDMGRDLDDLNEDLDELDSFLYDAVFGDGEGEEPDEEDDGDEPCYEVECPNCGETVYVTEADLEEKEAFCAGCGKSFGIELAEDSDEDEDADGDDGKYEVTCPHCGKVNVVDEADILGEEKLQCAGCGQPLLPWDEDEDEE